MKRDTEPPTAPSAAVLTAALREHEGYYHEANPRSQALAFMEWLRGGFRVAAAENGLEVTRVFGQPSRLLPVSDTLFRRESQAVATRVFARDRNGGTIVSATGSGSEIYAERMPRWRVEIVRWPVIAASVLMLTPLAVVVAWLLHARGARPAGFWPLKAWLVVTPLTLAWPFAALAARPVSEWGSRSAATIAVFLGTIALPTIAIATVFFANGARVRGASRWLVVYALGVALAALIVTAYLASYGLIGIRLWTY